MVCSPRLICVFCFMCICWFCILFYEYLFMLFGFVLVNGVICLYILVNLCLICSWIVYMLTFYGVLVWV